MKKFFKRRGQASLEFAFLLPIFALVLFALVYLGFLFIDVVTLDSAAAAAARSAAISTDGQPSNTVIKQIEKTQLFSPWYTIKKDGSNEVNLKRIPDKEHPENDEIFFTYGIQATRTVDNSVLKMILPEKYTVKKTAYKEEEP